MKNNVYFPCLFSNVINSNSVIISMISIMLLQILIAIRDKKEYSKNQRHGEIGEMGRAVNCDFLVIKLL